MSPTRSSLVVNHRIALSGTPQRSTVSSWRVEYIATRRGVVHSADMSGQGIAHVREEAIAAYMGERPGVVRGEGFSLFDQLGNVSLPDARRSIRACGGAVCCTVISVRREDAAALGLQTREQWERYVRANWQREFARMANIPESRVRYVAAMHCNQPNNLHVHVLTWDSSPGSPWDSVLPKRRMESGRIALVDAALKPELSRLGRVRAQARDAAVAAVRASDAGALRPAVDLPPDGSLDYGHLRRYHPSTARQVEAAMRRLTPSCPGADEAISRHGEATRAMGELKGYAGKRLEGYVSDARRDLDARLCNAIIDAMVPERTARPRSERCLRMSDGGSGSPSSRRIGLDSLAEEVSACLSPRERDALATAMRGGELVPTAVLRKCPTIASSLKRGVLRTGDLERAAAKGLTSATDKRRDTGSSLGDDAARVAVRALARAVLGAIKTRESAPSAKRMARDRVTAPENTLKSQIQKGTLR